MEAARISMISIATSTTFLPPRPRYFILMSQLPYTALAHGHKGMRGLRGKLQKATPRRVSSVAKLEKKIKNCFVISVS